MRSTLERIGPLAASLTLALSFLILVLAGLYTIDQQREVNQRICESAVDNRAGLRRTWQAAERFIIEGQTTEEGRQRTRDFFAVVLKEIPPIECVDRKPVEVR